MKLRSIFSAVLMLGLATTAKAQNNPQQLPEFKNKVMYVKKDNTLTDLDPTDLKSTMSNNMMGTAKIYLKAKGDHASVKRSGSPSNRFIVRLDPGTDPATVVELFRFEKKSRKFLVGKNSMGSTADIDMPNQKLTFSKVQDGVYIASPATQLQPGEYVFTVNRPEIDIMSAYGSSPIVKGFAFYVAEAEGD